MIRRLFLSAVFLLGAASAVFAQPPAMPRTRPSSDVIVTYHVEGPALTLIPGGIQGPVTLSWNAAANRLRAESDSRTQVALIDLHDHSGQVFDTSLRVVVPLSIKPRDLQFLALEGTHLTPTHRETIAGLVCNGYSFDTPNGPGAVCLTQDGVPLRGQGVVKGKSGSFTAIAVQYGPIPPDRFAVPAGYMALGSLQGGSQNGLAGLANKLRGSAGLNDLRNLLGRAQ